jgi:hypothetical protein
MMDTISQLLQGIEYLLLLVILIVFWTKAFRQRELQRNYWGLLALAWTMNLLGNVAWVVHDLLSKTPLGSLSAVDFFYGLRYVLLGAVLWFLPMRLSRRDGLLIGAAAFVVAVVVSIIYFESAMVLGDGHWLDFLGLAMYPVLDVAMITLAWLRARATREPWWNRNTLFLFCSAACYGIANTLNLAVYVFSAVRVGVFPSVFWILADVFLLIMALGDRGVKKDRE